MLSHGHGSDDEVGKVNDAAEEGLIVAVDTVAAVAAAIAAATDASLFVVVVVEVVGMLIL